MPRKDSQAVTNALLSQQLNSLNDTVKEGFKGVHDRQDTTNGRLSTAEKEILTLKLKQKWERVLGGTITVLVGIVVYFLTKGSG